VSAATGPSGSAAQPSDLMHAHIGLQRAVPQWLLGVSGSGCAGRGRAGGYTDESLRGMCTSDVVVGGSDKMYS
jgi:hypothetical protein